MEQKLNNILIEMCPDVNTNQRAVCKRVTPEIAKIYLEKGQNLQREFRKTNGKELAEIMRERGWILNGETIVISNNDECIDGQHRLWACVESGEPFETWVIIGVPIESFSVIDTGSNRTAKDIVDIDSKYHGSKIENSAKVTGAATFLLEEEVGKYGRRRPQRWKIAEFARKHPEIEIWVAKVMGCESKLVRSIASPLSAVLYKGAILHYEEADDFLSKLDTGEGLGKNHPILRLKNKLLNDAKPTRLKIFWGILKTWNAFIMNEEITKFHWPKEAEKIVGEDT